MKNGFAQAARQLFDEVSASSRLIFTQYPKHIVAVLAVASFAGTGATFALASLAPEEAELRVHQVIENLALNPIADEAVEDASSGATAPVPLRLYRTEYTRSSDTVDSLLRRVGVADPMAADYLRKDRLFQQNVLGRSMRSVRVETDASNNLEKLSARWSTDDDTNFKRLVIEKSSTGGFTSNVETAPLETSSSIASGVIYSSLYAATDEAHIPDSVANQLAEIFSGDIDFQRALRKGDHFTVIYESLMADGDPLKSGRVLSAEFVNAGKTYQAMWFADKSVTAGAKPKGGYYNLAGESLRRAYLASPLPFSRITSGFKMRFHPIFGKWKQHQGVDYGAPIGTPARSVANGVVDFAGAQGGYGNVVMIRHDAAHATVYAHLSHINVRKGQPVEQGQIVGLTGMTGWATGPHLHYEFRINGVARDPLTVARNSEPVPISASLRPAFTEAATDVKKELALAEQLVPADSQ